MGGSRRERRSYSGLLVHRLPPRDAARGALPPRRVSSPLPPGCFQAPGPFLTRCWSCWFSARRDPKVNAAF